MVSFRFSAQTESNLDRRKHQGEKYNEDNDLVCLVKKIGVHNRSSPDKTIFLRAGEDCKDCDEDICIMARRSGKEFPSVRSFGPVVLF